MFVELNYKKGGKEEKGGGEKKKRGELYRIRRGIRTTKTQKCEGFFIEVLDTRMAC